MFFCADRCSRATRARERFAPNDYLNTVSLYDPDGQLASSTGPAGTFTYSYNALEKLDSYTINGVRTNLLLDAADNVIAAYNASGNLIANYQYGLGLVSQQAPGGSNSFYDFDLTGNTTAITNSAGATVNTYGYLPFGEKLSSTGPAGNLFTYSGAEGVLDLGDGFYQTTYRTYSPTLGRFIQPDPSNFAGGDTNLYRYTANSPIGNVDPSGLGSVNLAAFFNSLSSAGKAAIDAVEGVAQTTGAVLESPEAIELEVEIHAEILKAIEEETGAALVGLTVPATGGASTPLELAEQAKTAKTIFKGLSLTGSLLFLVYEGIKNSPPLEAEPLHPPTAPAPPTRPFTWWADDPDIRDDYLDWVIKFKYRMGLFNSIDPNEIVGPAGGGANQEYITANQPLSYTVFFENQPTATAPAQDVTVTTTLDPNVDLSTFQLQSIGWGSEVLNVPPGLTSYSTRVSYVQPNTGKTILVDVSASLNFRRERSPGRSQRSTRRRWIRRPTRWRGSCRRIIPPGKATAYVSYAVDPVAGLPAARPSMPRPLSSLTKTPPSPPRPGPTSSTPALRRRAP